MQRINLARAAVPKQEGNGGRNALNSPSFQPQISCQDLPLVKARGQESLRYAVHGSASQGAENGRQWILGIGIQKIKQHNNHFIGTSPSPGRASLSLRSFPVCSFPQILPIQLHFPQPGTLHPVPHPPLPCQTFMSGVGENAGSPRIPFTVIGFFPI